MTPTMEATMRRRRSAPPQLMPLTAGYGSPLEEPVIAPEAPPEPPLAAAAGDGAGRPPSVKAVLTFDRSPVGRPRPFTTVGAAGDGLPRATPASLAAVGDRQDDRLGLGLIAQPPPAPVLGWAGVGAELRRGHGLVEAHAQRLDALDAAVSDEGIDVAAGEVVVLEVPGADRDVAERRPLLLVEGDPTRVVMIDTVGGVVRDVGLSRGAVQLPQRTARVALIGGGAPGDGTPGWWAGSQLVQIGARTLAGPGCTLTSSALSTRRRSAAVTTAFVDAAGAVAGYSLVTTRLPAGLKSVAIRLETYPGGGDESLELGIAGAETDGEPITIADGYVTTTVHSIATDDDTGVQVTVASGTALALAGVIGSPLPAAELAELVRERRFSGLAGTLVPTPAGSARVRWARPHDDGAPPR